MINILPREIRAQVKLPWIPRRRDPLHHAEKTQLIPELRLACATAQERRIRSEHLSLTLDRIQFQQKGGQSPRGNFRFTDDPSQDGHRLGLAAE